MRRNKPHKQGVVKTKDHLILEENQIISIVNEDDDFFYVVASFPNAPKVRILKKDLEIH